MLRLSDLRRTSWEISDQHFSRKKKSKLFILVLYVGYRRRMYKVMEVITISNEMAILKTKLFHIRLYTCLVMSHLFHFHKKMHFIYVTYTY